MFVTLMLAFYVVAIKAAEGLKAADGGTTAISAEIEQNNEPGQ
jgi:hypothetical protein